VVVSAGGPETNEFSSFFFVTANLFRDCAIISRFKDSVICGPASVTALKGREVIVAVVGNRQGGNRFGIVSVYFCHAFILRATASGQKAGRFAPGRKIPLPEHAI
jgi:hypothetical protein